MRAYHMSILMQMPPNQHVNTPHPNTQHLQKARVGQPLFPIIACVRALLQDGPHVFQLLAALQLFCDALRARRCGMYRVRWAGCLIIHIRYVYDTSRNDWYTFFFAMVPIVTSCGDCWGCDVVRTAIRRMSTQHALPPAETAPC